MTLHLTIPQTTHTDFTPKITVIGVGGGGTNAVNNMIALNLPGVDFVVANTDAQQLMLSRAERRVQLGPHITQGNGAGGRPEVGRASAEEAAEDLAQHLDGAHMVFITAGMGGGTGTGAAPVIARMARERNILTVGVVTKPFSFEGKRRMRAAEDGINELQDFVDTLIVIPNQNLFKVASERTGWKEAFQMADHVLYMGVRGITDLMVVPGHVNLDYADIRAVMAEMGKAMMGTGEAEGEDRAIRAADAAISNPLLEDTNMKGARGLLINITGGSDLTLHELDQAANRIREEVDEDANIMVGMALDESLNGRVRISVVATGIDTAPVQAERPRLVAVGGSSSMADAVATLVASANAATQTIGVTSAPAGTPHLGQHAAPAAPMQPQAQPPYHHTSAMQPAPHPAPAMGMESPRARAPLAGQASGSILAAPVGPSQRSPVSEPRKMSLFNRMTAALRNPAPAPAQAQPQREAQLPPQMAPQPHAPQPQMGQPHMGQPQMAQSHMAQPQLAHAPMSHPGYAQHPMQPQAPAAHQPPAPNQPPVRMAYDQHQEQRPAVRVAQTEDIGIDIPAFLRRQQS
ncbi:MAG TPA: cell division protein FtsZ [Acetobacteraceae bacterium]|nr:cell division protein FtsZ [Acetobacteraceae bacterium]